MDVLAPEKKISLEPDTIFLQTKWDFLESNQTEM